jgi:protein O-mannosyl-transferase
VVDKFVFMKKQFKKNIETQLDVSALKRLKKALGIFIAVFAFCLYAQSIAFDYANDDIALIKDNRLIQQGFSAIPALFTTDRMNGIDYELRMPEYRPFPMVIFAIEWQLSPNNPHFSHFINVLLYALTCWLLFLLLCKLFKNHNLVFPFVCALLYTAHPIHTEVVDNIKSLDEILCFLFAIVTIFLFVKFTEKRSVFTFTLASLGYLFCLLSKETGITFIIITPLILFIFSKSETKTIIIITSILAIITGIYLLIRYSVLESISQNTIDSLNNPFLNSLWAAPDFISQKATAFYILLRYVFLLIVPYQLSYDYSISQIPIQHIYNIGTLSGVICYLFLFVYSIIKIRKKNLLAFAILFYLLTLAPVSNIFILINWTMAERFLFMPSLGFCMLLSFILMKITKTGINKSNFNTIPKLIKINVQLFIMIFIIVGFYSIRTIARNPDWKNNVTLFSHDVKVVPKSARAHYLYGTAILFKLYPLEKIKEKQEELLSEAINEFTKAVSIYNNIPKAYSYIGTCYTDLGNNTEAITNYEVALKMFEPLPPAYVYCDLGLLYTYTGQYEKALSILDSSLKYYPNYEDAYFRKSHIYLLEGKNMEAISVCDKLLKFDSSAVTAYENKGCGYLNLKQYTQAIKYFNKGIKLDSANVECLNLLGRAYQEMGDTVKAKQYFEKARKVK